MTDDESVLDNPMWHALTTAHARLAEGDNLARRYPPTVTPLAGLVAQTPEAYASLECTLGGQGPVAFFLDTAPVPPADWEIVQTNLITQMVWRGMAPPPPDSRISTLGHHDIDEMMALATLTEPGPFGLRALELGTYLGIRVNGQLAAMAGERLHMDGFTEVSAVCTHPDHRRHGYSQALVAGVVRNVLAREETPMLHVRTDNTGAITVYEKGDFVIRRQIHLGVLKPPALLDAH